jgi:hypothetical protein
MAIEESRDLGGSQQDHTATDQGTIAIAGATESIGTTITVRPTDIGVQQISTSTETIASQLQSAPRQVSWAELKQLRGQYFTVRHGRVYPCGHRFDKITEPRTNCEYCWYNWLNSHGELIQSVDRAFQEQGKDFVIKLRGEKFLRMFLRYMSTIAKFKAEEEEKNEREASSVGRNSSEDQQRESGSDSEVRE